MAVMNASLANQFNSIYNSFANLYDILMDAYIADLEQGGNPDVEGLKAMKRKFIEATDYLRNNSNMKTELFNGDVVESMNWYKITPTQLKNLIDEIQGIFKILVTKSQSYIL